MSPDSEIELSVVVVTFNNEHEIARCLQSVLREATNLKAQIVVVDNHSEDGTVRQVETVRRRAGATEMELISNTSNVGFTRALNQGLRRSRGRWLLALNPDTVLHPGSVATLLTTLKSNPDIGVVAPQLLNPDGSVQPSCRRFPRRRDVVFEALGLARLFPTSRTLNHWKMGDFDHRQRRDVDQPQGACLLFRRELLEKVGEWDEAFPMFFSDVDWCKRVRDAGYRIVFESGAQVTHRQGASVMQRRAQMVWSSHKSFCRYFHKHSRRVPALSHLLSLFLVLLALPRVAWAVCAHSLRKA